MPRCARRSAGSASRSTPANRIVPASGGTIPLMVLNKVDLPAPFGPTTVTNCPSRTVSDTRVSACKPPYATDNPLISSMQAGQEFLAEIRLDHRVLLHHVTRFAGGEHATMVQHNEMIGDAQHGVHRVFDDDNGHALAAQPLQHVQHVVALIAAEPGERLV